MNLIFEACRIYLVFLLSLPKWSDSFQIIGPESIGTRGKNYTDVGFFIYPIRHHQPSQSICQVHFGKPFECFNQKMGNIFRSRHFCISPKHAHPHVDTIRLKQSSNCIGVRCRACMSRNPLRSMSLYRNKHWFHFNLFIDLDGFAVKQSTNKTISTVFCYKFRFLTDKYTISNTKEKKRKPTTKYGIN